MIVEELEVHGIFGEQILRFKYLVPCLAYDYIFYNLFSYSVVDSIEFETIEPVHNALKCYYPYSRQMVFNLILHMKSKTEEQNFDHSDIFVYFCMIL